MVADEQVAPADFPVPLSFEWTEPEREHRWMEWEEVVVDSKTTKQRSEPSEFPLNQLRLGFELSNFPALTHRRRPCE